ncbi:winged helix-turn-helix domain-containing protein [Granulicella sp. WH15]|uniref:winged helix-turn-helix domain-containing protein n=1 Tax=Granulicella sp. WH15 TaxID=2602070 RepID=UPI0021047E40|nr:winged helix-turn-helix domain-containing protein [Granulicella sp. WH15]
MIRFEEYAIDRDRWQLIWRNEPLPLNRKTFDLLLYLADHADRVVGKDELLRTLWPESFVEESNLTQHIFLLRKALSRHESGAKIIETVPGRGYRFAVAASAVEGQQNPGNQMVISASESITRITLEEEEEDTSKLSFQELEVSHPLLSAPSGKRRLYWVAGGLVAVAAVCVIGWFGWQRWMDRTGGPPVQVVVTGMDGTTGDLTLDRALLAALRIDLSQSPFVSLVPKDTVNATLVEMKQKPDDPITVVTARDLCERTNSQAVLHGMVVRNGTHFLLTEEATSCVDGTTLASARQEAGKPEELPRSIDRLAESIRRKLGESRNSVARFSARLSPATTASLEALKAYSESSRMSEQGKLPEAINLLKQAVADDPGFAVAWNDLWAYTASVNGDPISAREAIQKAYSLRDSAGALERLTITAHYDMVVVGDLFESERNYQAWTQLYPRSVIAWNGLSLTQQELGHYPDAEISAAHAVALRPRYAGLNLNLALAQMSTGNGQAARATCQHAIDQGIDSDHLRAGCLSVAYMLHDSAMLKTQRDWAAAHPQTPLFTIGEAGIAVGEGRFGDAGRLIAHAAQILRNQGLGSQADAYTRSMGINLIEAGDIEAGTRMLRASPPDPESGMDLVGLAEINDIAAATAGVRAMEKEHPQGTLWKLYWEPIIHAQIAMANRKPHDAVTLLEPTHQFDSKGIDLPMRRGLAYLAAGQPAFAEKDFRYVIANQRLDPTSSFYPLAWLQLGRALARENNRTAASDAYQHFLTLWVHADPDAIFVRQAKQELASLQTVAPAQ